MSSQPERLGQAARPDVRPPTPDLDAIEALMRRAIDERRPELLTIIGNGELTIAIKWDQGDESFVIKRVPPFPSRRTADEYTALVRGYLADFERLGVRCVTTDLYTLDRADGSAVVYHCQPLLDAPLLADHLLHGTEPTPEHPLVVTVVDTVVRCTAAGVPIDAQFANWYWFEGEAWQLDFSTPLMVDDRGDIRFDATGFTREYPAAVRRMVYKELMKIAPMFSDPVWTIEDMMTQLHRQGLERWCDAVTTAARERHELAVSAALSKERYEADAKFFPNLLRMKRFQRAWMQRTRRRYDTLLPITTSFGK